MSTQTSGMTVRKEIIVACPAEHAFTTFTDGITSWWPLGRHSVGEARARSVVFEGRNGGRIYEVWDDGTECDWGSVLVWQPPRRIVFSWQPNRDRPAPTEVEVRFLPRGDTTRVELEHRAWERLGEAAAEARDGYDSGWDTVLGSYAEVAGGD